jgi:chromosome segregation ATPase
MSDERSAELAHTVASDDSSQSLPAELTAAAGEDPHANGGATVPQQPLSPAVPREQLLLQQAGDVIENLRTQMSELDRRGQNLTAQSAALENERRRLRLSAQQFEDQVQQREQDLRRQKAQCEQQAARLEEQQNQLQQQREQLVQQQAELEAQIQARDEQFREGVANIEEELAAERNARRQAMEEELQKLAETIARQHEQWHTEQAEHEQQHQQTLAARQAELAALEEQLDQMRQQKLADIQARESELQRKQVELEKRTRFHESHLEQLRRSLQRQQAECDRSHQRTRTGQVHFARLLDLQRQQLLRARDRLSQREESLERERHLIDDLRRSLQSRGSQEQQRCSEDRQAWEQERAAHQADIRRQQDMLALHARNLEARRARLDHLRDDLEQTHRQTLEIRLVVEQLWAQASQSFGEEATRKRIEQARSELAGSYETLQKTLDEQRADLEAAEQRLAEQRDRFRTERKEFTAWMSQHEQQLLQREQLLQRDIESAAEREAEWRTTRERWTLEKIEAESVIRQLLEELDNDLTRSLPVMAPPVESGEPLEATADPEEPQSAGKAAA